MDRQSQHILDVEASETVPLNPVPNHSTEDISSLNHITGHAFDVHERLLAATLANAAADIEKIVQNAPNAIATHRYRSYNHKTVLVIACTEAAVAAETLRTLYSSLKSKLGDEESFVDCRKLGWEPIHYLAQGANPAKLDVVLELIDRVNALTYFSENALHVLLQHSRTRSTIDVEVYTQSTSRTFTITDTEKENVTRCAEMLIRRGVDVNQSNIWGETPICLAIGNVYPNVIRKLQGMDNISLDNNIGALTVEEYLRRHDLLRGSASSVQVSPISKLFGFLKSGEEDWFLNYNKGNIQDYVNCTEDCGGTMLQMCLIKGFFEYLKHDSYCKELQEADMKDTPMLRVFNASKLKKCIIHLLDNGADTSLTTTKFKTPLLEYAAVRGFYPFVAVLLQHENSRISNDEIFSTLSKLCSTNKTGLRNHKYYERFVLRLLLHKLITERDSQSGNQSFTRKKIRVLNTLLSRLNVELDDDGIDDSVIICQLLRLGGSLTTLRQPNASTDSAEQNSSQLILEVVHPSILRSHMNDCLRNNVFNYNSIIQDEDSYYSETSVVHHFVTTEQKNELLLHPLFIYFLHEKWSRISKVFYLNLIIIFLFLISIYVYMITISEKIAFPLLTLMKYSFYTLLIVHSLKELVQLFFLFYWKYFQDINNYIELSLILSCCFTVFYENTYCKVIAVIMSTYIFFATLGQLPNFSKYTVIFGSLKYFLQYVAFYFVQFISFAICFYIIFPFETNESTGEVSTPINSTMGNKTAGQILGDLSKNLFYTIVYFTGEFSERILEPQEHYFFGRVFTIFFIFCMTIILNNLLVALIVADMDEIQKRGRLYKQVKMANFIRTSDTFIERIHDFKSFDCIKRIIEHINIFKKDKDKVLLVDDVKAAKLFDDDDKELFKDIRNQRAFGVDVLKDVYNLISR